MDAVLRATAVYVFLVIVFRIAGRRTLMEMTTFDFILLLILSEATQNAMIGNDYSVTNGFLVILTLVGLDITLSSMKHRNPVMQKWLDGVPMILVENGHPLKHLMDKAGRRRRHHGVGPQITGGRTDGSNQVCSPGKQRRHFHYSQIDCH